MRKIPLFILIVITMSFSCSKRAEKEKFLIPNGYRGRIVIFFNQSNGSAKEYIDKTRIYRIPLSGILLTQFEENPGFLSVEQNEIAYVFYDDSTKKEENIPIKPLNPDPEKIYVFYGRAGSMNDYPYYECIIDTQKNIQNYFTRNEQGINIEYSDKWDRILERAGLRR